MVARLALQTKESRDGVKVVAIDPAAPCASGIRRALSSCCIAWPTEPRELPAVEVNPAASPERY